jgi:hypothetical protein
MVSPELLTMPQPMSGMGYSERTFYITNVGEGELNLQSITLAEDDNEEELFLELNESWTSESGPILAAAETAEVKVVWRPVDSLADNARIEIVSDKGTKSIEVTTPVPNSVISIMVDPAGVPTNNGQAITLEATPSTWTRDVVTLISDTWAAITLSDVCLSNAEGECITPEDNTVSLCREVDSNPSSCVPLGTYPELNTMQSYTFSLLFAADRVREGRAYIQINSDAQNRPLYQIEVKTIACQKTDGTEQCGACGDGEVNASLGEVCDDGNLNDTDDCANNCQPSCTLTNSCAAEDGDSDGLNDSLSDSDQDPYWQTDVPESVAQIASYLGYPIKRPDQNLYGTICVKNETNRDKKCILRNPLMNLQNNI